MVNVRRPQPPNPLARVSTEELLLELRRHMIVPQHARGVWEEWGGLHPRGDWSEEASCARVGSASVDRFQVRSK